jgi:hypothetical protein
MSREYHSKLSAILFWVILAFFSGIFIGSKTMTAKYEKQTKILERNAYNCLEVIIGKRNKKKLCE